MVPRWRDSLIALSAGELGSWQEATREIPISFEHLRGKVDDWRSDRRPTLAAEVASAALVLDAVSEGQEAAEFLLQGSVQSTEAARKVARRVLGQEGATPLTLNMFEEVAAPTDLVKPRIHTMRKRLHNEPRNAITWVDLARLYSMIGQSRHAAEAMSLALLLAPRNRFVLRSASRLFLHSGEPDRAHDVLKNSETIRRDPWILSAEIAVAELAKRQSRHTKVAKDLLGSSSISPRHLSELGSAMGTLQLTAGNRRQARRLFNDSLIDPTDNAIAQANWAKRLILGVDIREDHLSSPFSFEARAWDRYYASDWSGALQGVSEWFEDEPYSSEPLILGSFVASLAMEDYDLAVSLCRKGLVSNPDLTLLRNNLIFALASQNLLDEAEAEYEDIRNHSLKLEDEVCRIANSGLIQYRRGDIESGRRLYREAFELAGRSSNPDLRLLAATFWIREERRTKSEQEPLLLSEIEEEVKKSSNPAVRLAVSKLHGSDIGGSTTS